MIHTSYKLASELLKTPWWLYPGYVEDNKAVLNKLINGEFSLENIPEERASHAKILCIAQNEGKAVSFLDSDPKDICENSIFVMPICGPLTKSDQMCDYGTASLACFLRDADENPNIIGHILHVTSPGGASTSVECLVEAILNCEKPVHAVISEMAASAAVGIISACDKIWLEDRVGIVGSVGTMANIVDDSAAMAKEGRRIITVNATGSPDKNRDSEEAVLGNFDPILKNVLNPINEVFLDLVTSNRKKIKPEALTGNVFIGQEAIDVGLVDAFGNIEDAINAIMKTKDYNTLSKFSGVKLVGAQREEALGVLSGLGIDLGVNVENLLYTTNDAKKIYVYAQDGEDPTGKQCVFADPQGQPTTNNVPAGTYVLDDGSTMTVSEKAGLSYCDSVVAGAAPAPAGAPGAAPVASPAPTPPPAGNVLTLESVKQLLDEQKALHDKELVDLKNEITAGKPPVNGPVNVKSTIAIPKREFKTFATRKEEINSKLK